MPPGELRGKRPQRSRWRFPFRKGSNTKPQWKKNEALMKLIKICLLTFCCVLIAGCTRIVRPISNAAYAESSKRGMYCGPETAPAATQYQGELSEFDVLGITRGQATSENEIRRALEQAKSVKLRPSSSILLIQSGAAFPDGPMMEEL